MAKRIMDCDLCSAKDLNEVLILRSNRFSKYAPKKTQKASRVCWECARELFSKRLYNFGTSWRNLFFSLGGFVDRNREKYMVIHA